MIPEADYASDSEEEEGEKEEEEEDAQRGGGATAAADLSHLVVPDPDYFYSCRWKPPAKKHNTHPKKRRLTLHADTSRTTVTTTQAVLKW